MMKLMVFRVVLPDVKLAEQDPGIGQCNRNLLLPNLNYRILINPFTGRWQLQPGET